MASPPSSLHITAFDQRGHGRTSQEPLTASSDQVKAWRAEGKQVALEKGAKRRTGGWAKALPDIEWFVKRQSQVAKAKGKKLFLHGFSMVGPSSLTSSVSIPVRVLKEDIKNEQMLTRAGRRGGTRFCHSTCGTTGSGDRQASIWCHCRRSVDQANDPGFFHPGESGQYSLQSRSRQFPHARENECQRKSITQTTASFASRSLACPLIGIAPIA